MFCCALQQAMPGGSAWKWNPIRGEYYLHRFLKVQPHLNYRNLDLVAEMDNVSLFWLKRGVSGFRVDAAEHLFQIPIPDMVDANEEPFSGEHPYTQNLPEAMKLTKYWGDVLDRYSAETNSEPK